MNINKNINLGNFHYSDWHDIDLLSKAKPILDKVVRTMGAVELGRISPFGFSVYPRYRGAAIDATNQIHIAVDLLEALLGRNNAYSTSEVMGVLAHEIGHRISKDLEETPKKILESAGCRVESLDDIAEFYKSLEHKYYRMPPEKASAKRLWEGFIKYGVKEHAKKEGEIENYYHPTFYRSMVDLMEECDVPAYQQGSYDDELDDYKEQNYKIALESIGCKIESWDDISEFRSAFWKDFEILPEKESARNLCFAFLKYYNKYVDGIIKKQIIKSIDWKQMWNSLVNDFTKNHPEWDRDDERRADLHTMRDPALARGLRDYFVRKITYCKANRNACTVGFLEDSSSHPSLRNRVTYMTQAICKNYPEENRDICSDVRLPRNATCPSSNRFILI